MNHLPPTWRGSFMTRIKAIPTNYRGILFRSKLEAEWAKYFDSIDLKWVYEVEGYQISDDIYYLPDFWLPDCKTFFEVKGIIDEQDLNKIKNLARAVAPKGIMVAIGRTQVPDSLGLVTPIPFLWDDEWACENGADIIDDRDCVDIAICQQCDKPYIIYLCQGWSCRNCGYYDGDNTWKDLIFRCKI